MAKGLPCPSGKLGRDAYRAWLFEQQEGHCYLGITACCKTADRKMILERGRGVLKARFATFEHVHPLSSGVRPILIMLACSKCNQRKNGAPPAPEHVAVAYDLRKKWFETKGGSAVEPPARIGRAAQEQIEREYRARKRAIGLEPGYRSSKALQKMRTHTAECLGR